MALARTDGWAISVPGSGAFPEIGPPYVAPEVPKCSLLATQRPGSTQNTLRSTGSLSAGTMRSFPITRSCLPPVTISPARSSNGRFELLISTNRFTSAFSRRTAGVRPLRISPRTFPYSVTTTSPDRKPSSSVRNSPVA